MYTYMYIYNMYICTYVYIRAYGRWVAQIERMIDMGWLRLVGSLKLYVSFAEYPLFYRALLK